MNQTISSYDIPTTVKQVINTAIEMQVIEAADVYSLSSEFGTDWTGLVDRLCEYAFTWIHSDREKHSETVKAAELFWQERAINTAATYRGAA